MLTIHWLELVFGGVILSTIFFILGALDGVAVEVEPERYYTPEEDAYWAEYVKLVERKNALR